MDAAERFVLHVLPHPGGGGETYVDLLAGMAGYRFSRVFLAPSPRPTPALARGVANAFRQARRHDLLHVHGEVAAGLCLPLLATRPSVVTLHGLHLVRRLRGARRAAAVLNLRAVVRTADLTICVSRAEHDHLVAVLGPRAARRAVVIRNGVRIPPVTTAAERAAVRRELGISEDEVVAIWVGSLDERKDPVTAVRAANRADVTLLVVGDGPLRSEVERIASERVRVLGQREDVPRLLTAADFYILTSRREGLALSLLEAMARGLVPIVTDLPENREAVGEARITVCNGDEAALAALLIRTARTGHEPLALGQKARCRIVKLFDAKEMVDRTRVVYGDVRGAELDD